MIKATLTAVLLLTVSTFAQEIPETFDVSPVPDNPASRVHHELKLTANPATGKLPQNIRARELQFSASIPTIAERGGETMKTSGVAAQTWMPRGPFNVGGRARALAIDVENPMNILSGGVSGGMWRSIDGGTSWVLTTDITGLRGVSCLVQDTRPGRTNTWYYGTGEYHVSYQELYRGDGLFKSTDNGASWDAIPSTVSSLPHELNNWSYVYRLVVDHTNLTEDVLYAATVGGVFRSSNGGTDWELVLGRESSSMDRLSFKTDITIDPNGVLYAMLSSVVVNQSGIPVSIQPEAGGLFRSENGIDWVDITPEGYPTGTWRIVADAAPSDPNTVYFLSSNWDEGFETVNFTGSADYSGLYKYTYISGDGSGTGGAWEDLSDNLPVFGNYGRFNTQSGYNLVVKINPENPEIVYLGATSLYRSTDGFATNSNTSWIGGYHHDFKLEDPLFDWLNIFYPNHHPDVHEIVFAADDAKVMYTATDGGVSKTMDCESEEVEWTELNNGLISTQFYALGIHPSAIGDERIVGGLQDNGTFASLGSSDQWRMVGSGDGFGCEIAPDEENTYYCSMYSGIVTKATTDEDLNVSAVQRISGISLANDGFGFRTDWYLDPSDPNTGYLAGREYIYRNTDLSNPDVLNNWEQLTATGPVRGFISAMTPTYGTPTGIYFATDEGWLYWLDEAKTTTDKPVRIDDGAFPFKGNISCIAVDKIDQNKLLVVVSNYELPSLFFSADGGQSWEDVSGNLEEQPDGLGAGPSCRWAEIVTRQGGTLYLVGTSTGLYSTTDLAGQSTVWMKEGATSIGSSIVTCMRSRNSDGFVAVGTYGSGVFSSNVSTVSVKAAQHLPGTLYLESAYPNPVAGNVTVRFGIPDAGNVRLVLFDASGRVIRTLYEGAPGVGLHTQEIATAGLPAGNYFLSLSSATSASTRMVTVRR